MVPRRAAPLGVEIDAVVIILKNSFNGEKELNLEALGVLWGCACSGARARSALSRWRCDHETRVKARAEMLVPNRPHNGISM